MAHHIRLFRLGLYLTIVGIYLSGSHSLAEQRTVPNSHLSLDVSQDFAPASRFTGFISARLKSSIVIAEFPVAAYTSFDKGFTPKALEKKSIFNVKRQTLPKRTGTYIYLRGLQRTPAGSFEKFFLVLKSSIRTVLVTINVPAAVLKSKNFNVKQIEAILRSSSISANPVRGASLFSLSYLAEFEQITSLLGSTEAYRLKASAAKTFNAELGNSKIEPPIFVVAPSLHNLKQFDLKETARSAMKSLSAYQTVSITSEKVVEIGGLKGFEMVSVGIANNSKRKVHIYQVMLKGRVGGYYRLLGIIDQIRSERFIPEFRKMAHGFKPAANP